MRYRKQSKARQRIIRAVVKAMDLRRDGRITRREEELIKAHLYRVFERTP